MTPMRYGVAGGKHLGAILMRAKCQTNSGAGGVRIMKTVCVPLDHRDLIDGL